MNCDEKLFDIIAGTAMATECLHVLINGTSHYLHDDHWKLRMVDGISCTKIQLCSVIQTIILITKLKCTDMGYRRHEYSSNQAERVERNNNVKPALLFR